MNIHPMFVHFPIALLTVYAFMEFLRFKPLQEWAPWFYIKASAVILGSISTVAALGTGELAEDALRSEGGLHGLIEMHSRLAAGASVIFGVIALAYAVSWIERQNGFSWIGAIFGGKFEEMFLACKNVVVRSIDGILKHPIMTVFALAGLGAIMATGALGGAIVYGPDTDPIVRFVYSAYSLFM